MKLATSKMLEKELHYNDQFQPLESMDYITPMSIKMF